MISIRMHSIERLFVRETGKYTICRPICARFIPEIVSVGAVKMLKEEEEEENATVPQVASGDKKAKGADLFTPPNAQV